MNNLKEYLKEVWHQENIKDIDACSIGYILQNAEGSPNDCDIAELMIQGYDRLIWLEYAKINNLDVDQTSSEYWKSEHYVQASRKTIATTL